MKNISEVRLKELAARSEDQIDYSEIPELGADFWRNARIVEPATAKQQLTIRIDSDVLDWFRSKGKGYQSRMNAVLRAYVEAQNR